MQMECSIQFISRGDDGEKCVIQSGSLIMNIRLL